MNFRAIHDFWKLNGLEDAEKLAVIEREKNPGMVILAYDYGECVRPRFGIIEAPKVGDDVSYAFNGDSYPCGKVEKIGKDYKRIKAGGKWYYRRGAKPTWENGCWALIGGIHNDRNPSF